MKEKYLNSNYRPDIEAYINKKFNHWKKGMFSKKSRQAKAIHYWCQAEFRNLFREVVEDRYPAIFGEPFPLAEAKIALKQQNSQFQQKVGGHIKLQNNKRKLSDVTLAVEKLENFETPKIAPPMNYTGSELDKYFDKLDNATGMQKGDDGFRQLKTIVESALDKDEAENTFSLIDLNKSFDHSWKKELTSSGSYADKVGKAEFNGIIGYEQKAGITFEAADVDWGEVQVKIEESFKAGAWNSGNVEMKIKGLGVSAEVKAALAVGAQLQVKANATWKKGNLGLDLGGDATAFAGANGYLKGKLKANAIDGINLALKAGAFAGVKGTVKGNFKFHYDGETLFAGKAQASVSAGAGGSVDFDVQASIFGPTSITIGADLTIGLGAGAKSKMLVNFNGIYLAGRAAFRQVVYLKTVSKGYKQDLLKGDIKNEFYLNKSIKKLNAVKTLLEEEIKDAEENPMNVSLLMDV